MSGLSIRAGESPAMPTVPENPMDDLDRAESYESIAREAALKRHAARPRVVPDCEACGQVPAHVTSSGVTWRFCADCAEDHLKKRRGS